MSVIFWYVKSLIRVENIIYPLISLEEVRKNVLVWVTHFKLAPGHSSEWQSAERSTNSILRYFFTNLLSTTTLLCVMMLDVVAPLIDNLSIFPRFWQFSLLLISQVCQKFRWILFITNILSFQSHRLFHFSQNKGHSRKSSEADSAEPHFLKMSEPLLSQLREWRLHPFWEKLTRIQKSHNCNNTIKIIDPWGLYYKNVIINYCHIIIS